ncbi:MAG: hypothetical protein ACYC9M_10670 [Desulfobulbaceae bacterium]
MLNFAGLEKYDQLFMPKSSYPIFVPGEGDRSEYYVTSPHFGKYLNTQSFLRNKPVGVTRIFVVGGSAAYGFPYTEEYGITGYLRRALDKTMPGRFEIINGAGMSFGSHRVLDVLKDMTDIRSNPQVNRGNIGRSGQTDTAILENYRGNLSAMKDLLLQNGVKVIFCTVPVDLGGWLPDEAMPQFADEAAANRWQELLNLRDEAFSRGDIAQEAEYLRQILEITPTDPGMLFNYGKVLWTLGNYEGSYRELVKAKDFDYRPIRALSSFNGVVRSLIDEQRGAYLADLEGLIKEKFLQGQAQGLFLDYCHLTEAGNKLVAERFLPVLDRVAGGSGIDIPRVAGLIRSDDRARSKDDFVRGHELYAQAMTFENTAGLTWPRAAT